IQAVIRSNTSASRWTGRRWASRLRVTRPASSSTLRCLETAWRLTSYGAASSPTVASPSVRRATRSRRVGSASAANNRDSSSAIASTLLNLVVDNDRRANDAILSTTWLSTDRAPGSVRPFRLGPPRDSLSSSGAHLNEAAAVRPAGRPAGAGAGGDLAAGTRVGGRCPASRLLLRQADQPGHRQPGEGCHGQGLPDQHRHPVWSG